MNEYTVRIGKLGLYEETTVIASEYFVKEYGVSFVGEHGERVLFLPHDQVGLIELLGEYNG